MDTKTPFDPSKSDLCLSEPFIKSEQQPWHLVAEQDSGEARVAWNCGSDTQQLGDPGPVTQPLCSCKTQATAALDARLLTGDI